MRALLRGLRIWTGAPRAAGETATVGGDLLVQDERLSVVGGRCAARDADRVWDYDGCFAVPGLIDAHVHLCLDPALLSPDDQAKVPPRERDAAMEQRALDMVRAGITTARDLGEGEWRALRLRDRIAAGSVPGPRLLCAGQPLTSAGGHCHFWGGEAEGRDAQRAVIARQIDRGVDWIKVMATGGVFTKGSGVRTVQFEMAELAAAVAQSAAAGLGVAAHCHGRAGIENAAAAGVRTVEHCSFAGEEGFGSDFDAATVALLRERGTVVSPTVNAGWGRRATRDGEPTGFFGRMSRVLRALRDEGVPMIASTDAGIPGVRHDALAEGIVAFAHYADLTPLDALRSATVDSAAALGLGGVCGALVPGLSADILILDGDPLLDLGALCRPVAVHARGRLAPPPE